MVYALIFLAFAPMVIYSAYSMVWSIKGNFALVARLFAFGLVLCALLALWNLCAVLCASWALLSVWLAPLALNFRLCCAFALSAVLVLGSCAEWRFRAVFVALSRPAL